MPVASRQRVSLAILVSSFAALVGGALAQANVGPAHGPFPALAAAVKPARALFQQAPILRPTPQYVWTGKDLDGDGAADFVNPTGKEVRDHDGFGDGEFGASRDGGVRRHEGADYIARAGQEAVAPISGYVTKIGFAYADAPELKFVEVTNPALKVSARVFYVEPSVTVGQSLRMGEALGRVHSLQARYAGITDHVHLEIAEAGARVNPETLILAKLKTPTVRG